jgi:hypothetical protein
MMDEVISLDESDLGPNHPSVVTDLSRQAQLQLRRGDLAAAAQRSDAAELRLAESVKSGAALGDGARAVMGFNRAAVLISSKRYEQARDELTRSEALARSQQADPTLPINLAVIDALLRWESSHDPTALERANQALAAARALPDAETVLAAQDVVAHIKAGGPQSR